jgi:hypothetical protein
MQAIEKVGDRMLQFLMVGQRWDLDIIEPLDFAAGWEERLRIDVAKRGRLRPPDAIDYFAFSRGTWGQIPPFAIGRSRWDNWLIYEARTRGVDVVDATQVVMPIHQNHDYAHVENGEQGTWEGPEAERNMSLAGGWSHLCTVDNANRLLTKSGLVPAYARWLLMSPRSALTLVRWRLERRLVIWRFCHPGVGAKLTKVRGWVSLARQQPRNILSAIRTIF